MAKKQKKVRNPLTGKKLTREQSDYVRTVRAAHAQARRETRSGDPAKRAAAMTALRTAPRILAAVYRQEAHR